MKMFRFNPTVRETNKYLSRVVDELLKKHGGVSNDDFERDLVNTTGIGWKQAKNYKNHPRPGERLKDNAVVLKFIASAQARDVARKVRRISIFVICMAVVAYGAFRYAITPRETEHFVVHEVPPNDHRSEVAATKVFLKLPSNGWLFRLGPIEASSVPVEEFTCLDVQGTGTRNCSLRQAGMEATLILDGTVVRRYSLISYELDDINGIKKQLAGLLGDKLKDFPSSNKELDELNLIEGSESVNLMSTSPGKNMRPMLSVTVSLQ